MISNRRSRNKIVKETEAVDSSTEPEELSREKAIELLMLDDENRPTSPRHPRESLNSEERVSIPNVDVEVDLPSSPVIPPNRKKRPIVRRSNVVRRSAASVTIGSVDKTDEEDIPMGIPPKRNNTPNFTSSSTKSVTPSIPIGLKPVTPVAIPVATPDRLGPSPSLIKPSATMSATPHIKSVTPATPATPAMLVTPHIKSATPAMSATPNQPTASPFPRATPIRMGPSPSIRSLTPKVATQALPATPVPLASPVQSLTPKVATTPIRTPAPSVMRNMTPSNSPAPPASPASPTSPGLPTLPTGKRLINTAKPKVVISTVPEDSDEDDVYPYNDNVTPIYPNNTESIRRKPEPAFIPLPKNKDGIPDYSSLDVVQQAAKWSEFEVKFNTIREANPTYEITLPDRNNETLEEVYVRHREYVKHIAKSEFVDECVEEYRAYLIIVWGLIELLCSKLLVIPSAGGYFVFQLARFKKYEGLLVQLGEQGWSESKGKSASPLWSIILSSIVTAVVFILVNFLLGSLGNGISREVSDKAIAFLLGERVEEEEGGIADMIRQLTGGTGDLSSVLDTIRGMAGFFGGNLAPASA